MSNNIVHAFIPPVGNDAPFGVQAVAGSKDLHRDNSYRTLIPGIFTEAHPRLCFYLEHKYVS